METQVRTPQLVFMQPQRLIVPLFQRPYVWNEENQWQPLWDDVARLTDRLLAQPHAKQFPHFLGAVVLQLVQKPTGTMQERTIIDGQQRLTTLQLLLDALHAELLAVNAAAPAMRLEPLIENAKPFCRHAVDRYKVWPTNRDRPAFHAVMGAEPPVDHDSLGHSGERMVEAHRFFSKQAREWLTKEGADQIEPRAAAIETVCRDLLHMVVIDLAAEENAQEIFETLNARGAQLTAADLIKNFVFQRLQESGDDEAVQQAYERYWKEFETAFWETEVSVGRVRAPRSSIFLNHWLIARTGKEVVAREVFTRFKRFAEEAGVPMTKLLEQIHRAAEVYRKFVLQAENMTGPVDRLGLFAYRTGVMESEVIKPLVLYLLDPEVKPIPASQLTKALDVIESWMVRRMLLRVTAKNYNTMMPELITSLRKEGRDLAGDRLQKLLADETSDSRYWPDDKELFEELRVLPAYRRLGRGRLRMVMEAIEDHKRGWRDGKEGLGGERVPRGKFTIEHILPRKWTPQNWPLPDGPRSESEREGLLHTLGNLTLLTSSLNTKVSNGPWLGASGKKQGLEAHDVLKLNHELLKQVGDDWTESAIRQRSDELASLISEIWPVPPGHVSGFGREKVVPRHKVDLSDLLSADWLQAGMALYPRRKKFAETVATLLPDGRVDVAGAVYAGPSEAAKSIRGKPTNGWWFFLVDQQKKRSLGELRGDYLESFAVDTDEDDPGDEGDDDES